MSRFYMEIRGSMTQISLMTTDLMKEIDSDYTYKKLVKILTQ